MRLGSAALAVVGVILVLVGAIVACQHAEPPGPRIAASTVVPPAPDPHAPAVVVVRGGSPPPATRAAIAWVEVVSKRAERERGLGGRTGLEPDHGMLFVYKSPTPHRFWMKDCLIGLDIAFVREDGAITAIATLPAAAGLPDEEIPAADSGEPVRWVLEMETGWFARHGVAAGARIDVSAAILGVEAE